MPSVRSVLCKLIIVLSVMGAYLFIRDFAPQYVPMAPMRIMDSASHALFLASVVTLLILAINV